MLKNLGEEISDIKKQHVLSESDVDNLKRISNVSSKGKEGTIRSKFSLDSPSEKTLNPSWISRFRLDSINLYERILTCQDLRIKVQEKLREITKG